MTLCFQIFRHHCSRRFSCAGPTGHFRPLDPPSWRPIRYRLQDLPQDAPSPRPTSGTHPDSDRAKMLHSAPRSAVADLGRVDPYRKVSGQC